VDSFRVWADIDLDALEHNLGVIASRIAPGVAVMLVAKADAYGHGAVAVAHHAVRCGVACIGVGTATEALELRRAGVRARILILGTVVDQEVPAALRHGIEIGLHSTDRCATLQRAAEQLGTLCRVHLNVDTGMGRLGVLPERALDLLREIRRASHLELAGVMTHITAPDGAHAESTALQTRRFRDALATARKEGLVQGWLHLANSACIFTGLDPMGDAVRPGISAFGILPPELPGADELRPVMSLRSQVVFLKDLSMGSTLGYGNTWRAARRTRVATLPLGYNDGVDWRLSNSGVVLVRGKRANIIGRVSMDYTTIDVTDIPGVAVGDPATLIGADGDECLTVLELASTAGTIPYEITCSVGRRVARIYTGAPHGPTANEDKDILVPRPAAGIPAISPISRKARTRG
jgi:alanine racemase